MIVDIDITQEEGDCVYYAQNYMSGFDARPTQSLKSDTSFSFHSDPQVIYAEIEPTVRVAAVVEVFGLAFTQGVNEMQTLANLSSSRDCLKQGEINFASLVRLKGFFGNYRAALSYQLEFNREKMADYIQTMNSNLGGTGGNAANGSAAAAAASAPAPTRGNLQQMRNRAMRNSIFIGGAAGASGGSIGRDIIDRKVEVFVTKVLQYNDR